MKTKIVLLEQRHLLKLVPDMGCVGMSAESLGKAYFSPGSLAYCLMVEGEPVCAGGIVNLEWHRGEAWMLPTPFFRKHVKTCLRVMREWLPVAAMSGGFIRVQATCKEGLSEKLFEKLGFECEGVLKHFGPFGEDCSMYARFFVAEAK